MNKSVTPYAPAGRESLIPLRELSHDFHKQLLIDDPLTEVVYEYLNKMHAGPLAERDVLVAKTKVNMMTDTKETAAINTREPA